MTQTKSADPWPAHTGAVELRNEIGKAVGIDLPGTLVFDYPTVRAISGWLTSKLLTSRQPLAIAAAAPARCSACFHLRMTRCAISQGIFLC